MRDHTQVSGHPWAVWEYPVTPRGRKKHPAPFANDYMPQGSDCACSRNSQRLGIPDLLDFDPLLPGSGGGRINKAGTDCIHPGAKELKGEVRELLLRT